MDDLGLEQRYREVMERVHQAAVSAGRNPGEITTVVVTKFHPPKLIEQLVALGVRDIGESRHQEAVAKHTALGHLPLTWHFVGQLQSNKAKAVAEYCQVIHSLDRPSVVDKIAASGRKVQGFIEINLTDDPARGGVWPDDLLVLVERVVASDTIELRGVMAVAPQEQSPEAAFERVLRYREQVLGVAPESTDLSLGMSGDFESAIAVGATHLRIGSAITGKRPTPA